VGTPKQTSTFPQAVPQRTDRLEGLQKFMNAVAAILIRTGAAFFIAVAGG